MKVECQNCGLLAAEMRNRSEAEFEAMLRFEGWRIFDGTSLTGKDLHVVLCFQCVEAPAKPRPAKVLPGQEGFDFG